MKENDLQNPKLWTLGPEHYSYRVQFDFVDEAGTLVKTKTWEVRRKYDDPPQLLFLQLSAQLLLLSKLCGTPG